MVFHSNRFKANRQTIITILNPPEKGKETKETRTFLIIHIKKRSNSTPLEWLKLSCVLEISVGRGRICWVIPPPLPHPNHLYISDLQTFKTWDTLLIQICIWGPFIPSILSPPHRYFYLDHVAVSTHPSIRIQTNMGSQPTS